MKLRTLPTNLLIGLSLLLVVVILAIIGPIFWGAAAGDTNGPLRAGASGEYLLGTDAQGRDVFARTMVATRLSLVMALVSTAISMLLGGLIGLTIAMSGYRVNWWGGRVIDLLVSWPPIVIALAVTAILRPSAPVVALAVGIAAAPQFARMTYTLARTEALREHATTAKMIGVSWGRLLFRHVLPGITSPLLVLGSAIFASALLAMSGLSFIGLGVQAPQFDWGTMLSSGLASLYSNPIEILGPSLMIVTTGVAAGLVGDGLARLNDPRRQLRKSGQSAGIEEKETSVVSGAHEADEPETPVLRVRGLRVGVAGVGNEIAQELVHGIDFDIRRGEILGIVGESGSGKSVSAMSAIELIPQGLVRTASQLHCAGIDLNAANAPLRDLATRVGVVFQDPSSTFNPAQRLGAQLTEAIRVHRRVSRREAEALAIDQLRAVRMTQPELRVKQYPHELSGGMRQRAMIAMSLLSQPDLLIADEPTTALDVTVQAEVLRLLRQMNEELGTAVLLVSHDISVVSALCHRVLVMKDGAIVEQLTPEQIRRGTAAHPYTRALLSSTVRARLAAQRGALV